MNLRVRTGITVTLMVAALGLAGCGDNENGNVNDNNDNRPPTGTRTVTPTAQTGTPTPAVTPTGGGAVTNADVAFTLTASSDIQGFRVTVGYPTAKGSFAGSGENVDCTRSTTGGEFIKNDLDNGSLNLVVGSASNIPSPQEITCRFVQNAGQTLETGDLTVTVNEVTVNGSQGNTSILTPTFTITPVS